MAHAQKPDFVFPRNGRVHLNRWGRQFSRLLAAEVCASAWVMLDRPRSEVAWEYWLPTPFVSFPLHSPPVRHRVPPGSERALPSHWHQRCRGPSQKYTTRNQNKNKRLEGLNEGWQWAWQVSRMCKPSATLVSESHSTVTVTYLPLHPLLHQPLPSLLMTELKGCLHSAPCSVKLS